jgi:hypothetical protein
MFDASELKALNQQISGLVPKAIKAWAAKFENKNDNYGNSWLLTGETFALWFPQGLTLNTPRKQIMHGLLTRMLDKMIRAAHLELADVQDKVGEKASETFFDLGVYAFMAGVACFMEAGVEAFEKAIQTQATLNAINNAIKS